MRVSAGRFARAHGVQKLLGAFALLREIGRGGKRCGVGIGQNVLLS